MEGTLQLQVAVVGKDEAWLGKQEFLQASKAGQKLKNSALRMGIDMYLYWCTIERVWDAGNS